MKKIFLGLGGVLGVGGLLCAVCLGSLGDSRLHVYYFDIGQGDAILVRTPGGEYVLIDGGPDELVLDELAAVMPFYERKIDVMMLSHPHADHVNGLIDILERYDVQTVMITGVQYSSAVHDRFLELIEKEDARLILVDGSADYRLGNVLMDVVYPVRSILGEKIENLNNASISFRLLYGDQSFYFSGDLEEEGEEELVKLGLDLSADVLKAGHHGSRTSTTAEFLELVGPRWAVISCGVGNRFGHPHPETIRKLQERDITIYRTDLDGTVEMASDGSDIKFLSGV